MYQVDSNDNTKSVPKARSISGIGKATTPAANIFTERPSYVLINQPGAYAFSYAINTGSIGGTHADVDAYETGSVVDDPASPVRLDINPIAWMQTDAAGTVGDVTFIYTGNVG